MHPHIPAEDNNTLLPLIHHFLQTQKPEQSCSCTALAAPAGFCSVPCSGDTATPPSPPRAGAQQADEIRTGSWQRKCFERSSLTHEKCSSSPAGKERKKSSASQPQPLQALSPGHCSERGHHHRTPQSQQICPASPSGQILWRRLWSINLGCSLTCSAVLGPEMLLEPLCKEMATCKKHQAGKVS